jgi:hypothetical protein
VFELFKLIRADLSLQVPVEKLMKIFRHGKMVSVVSIKTEGRRRSIQKFQKRSKMPVEEEDQHQGMRGMDGEIFPDLL